MVRRVNAHTVSELTVHIVLSSKYKYAVLLGDIKKYCRKIIVYKFNKQYWGWYFWSHRFYMLEFR